MKPLLPTPSSVRGARRQRGFTLVEMMVAVGIGLVVALGFAVSFVNLKATWGTQDKLAQLQDNERLAMAFLTSSIQEAGYFPDSINQTKKTGLPALTDATYGGTAAGQYIGGALASGGIPVTLSTVYGTASGDGVLNCQGATNTSGANVTYLNIFFVDTTNNTLSCAVTASNSTLSLTKAPLVSNVSLMSVQYAVDTNGDGSADKYLDANAVTTAAAWANVKAVRVTLNFINPNAALGGAQAATIPWTQTISLMNNK